MKLDVKTFNCMIIWIDVQLSPTLASWSVETFGITALSFKELGLHDAKDTDVEISG